MGTTPTYGWPYPELADPANAPADFQTALAAIEATVGSSTWTTYNTFAWTSDGAGQPGGTVTKSGMYKVLNGMCFVHLVLQGGASVNGGLGNLSLGLPFASNAIINQIMPARIYSPNAGAYSGFGLVIAGQARVTPHFPASSTDNRVGAWRNADNSGSASTGIPLAPGGNYNFVNGADVEISGHYIL